MQSRLPISNQQRTYTETIKPGASYTAYFSGSYIAMLTCSLEIDPVVSIDQGVSNALKAGTGFPTLRINEDGNSYSPAIFSKVVVTNPSLTQSMDVEFLLSLGVVTDTRLIVQGGVQVDTSGGTLDTPEAQTVGVDAFTILPANQEIKERVIQNTGDFDVWYGGEDLDPANKRGTMIYSGGTAVINCWGEIWFKSVDGETTISINNTMDA